MNDEHDVVARSLRYPGESFTAEEYEAVKDAVHDGRLGETLARPSVLVVGSYDDGERERLETVRDRLPDRYEAFLMSEVEEVWTHWTAKFKLLVANTELVVGVYEHSDGGHAWEAGYLEGRHRDRTVVLKRAYPDRDPVAEPFDAMTAHWIQSMRYVDSVYEWTPDDESGPDLGTAVDDLVADRLPRPEG